MLLWLNESKSLQLGSYIWWENFPEDHIWVECSVVHIHLVMQCIILAEVKCV